MSTEKRDFNILFVVCHPDDEALWAGGLICSFSVFPFIKINVLCLSGSGGESLREAEFFAAKNIAGYYKGIVMGGYLRPALEPLPKIPDTVESGIDKLGLTVHNIDLLVTHSPFGDEHLHPHHIQSYRQLHKWSYSHKVPFGFFSCIAMPYFCHFPLLRNLKRCGSFHLLNLSRCSHLRLSQFLNKEFLRCPKYYLQFLCDGNKKSAMLNCYQSIDLKKHQDNYAMFTSNVESLYIFDERGLIPFKVIMENLNLPGSEDLFSKLSYKRYINKVAKSVICKER